MITPYKKPRPKPEICWLLDDARCLHESYVELSLEDVDNSMQVWASAERITRLLLDGKGESLCWDNKPIRWAPSSGADDWPVRVLRVATPDKDEDALEGLLAWRDWLCEYGAAPATSLSASGMSLLKATLAKPLFTSAGDVPPITFTIGGRQEVGPHGTPVAFEGELRHWDMQAAYARTLGNLRYGGWWRHIEGKHVERLMRGQQRMMFVRAKVRVPVQEWAPLIGPLPRRPRTEPNPVQALLTPPEYPTGKTIQGVWTWQELRQAEAWGARIVKIIEGWFHFARPDSYPFKPWLDAVEQGRNIGGFAGLLAKSTGNSTWGLFAVRKKARRTTVRVENGRRVVTVTPHKSKGNPSSNAPDLAEYITGKVRAELYRGMMQADTDLICAHTDGLWLVGPMYIQGWRSKDAATRFRLISPQTFAYRRPKDAEDRYVVSGVAVQSAAPFFEDEWTQLEAPRPYALRVSDRAGRKVPTITQDGQTAHYP